jgi:hypothetical protein
VKKIDPDEAEMVTDCAAVKEPVVGVIEGALSARAGVQSKQLHKAANTSNSEVSAKESLFPRTFR